MSDFVTLWVVACQAPLSLGFSRQEDCGVDCHFLLRDLPDPWINPASHCVSCFGRRVLYHWCPLGSPVLSYKGTNAICRGPSLMTSFHPNYLSKASFQILASIDGICGREMQMFSPKHNPHIFKTSFSYGLSQSLHCSLLGIKTNGSSTLAFKFFNNVIETYLSQFSFFF